MSESESKTRQSAVLRALARVLRPVARLLIAGGVPIQAASESLKRAYVEAAQRHFGEEAGTDSRLSLLTGINRKEVRRLTTPAADEWGPESVTSFASAVYTAWTLREEWRGADGKPRALPLRGEGSFDVLVKGVTRDLRPSSVLAELVRLGYAETGVDDTVRPVGDAFLSQREFTDRLGPLAENLQDHADAAVANVLGASPPFLERTLFGDELSEESAKVLHEEARAHWKRVHDELIARADVLEAEDQRLGRPATTRIRVGVYVYVETPSGDATASPQKKESDED
ncbi:hypothetical protein DSM104443_03759 [Usitatibacter rugosus]|uniref:Uncharacterized protein n=1 Tax=Usitatibacter rugosus TaxID=2732067 RepID=A0A6M4H444_9PROT|nr:hypothetical protein DSM104443_03759 [Usitatibacter rugosus]